MKKTILMMCILLSTAKAFTQIITNKADIINVRVIEPLKLRNINRDSIEIKQLYDAYKIADADATNKLQLLIEKMKATNSNANAGNEMTMVKLQKMMEERKAFVEIMKEVIKMLMKTTEEINTATENIGK
jgi:hypothetical protein